MDDLEYLKKQEEDEKRHEALCVRCGECCGANGIDPCANLARDEKDMYYCKIYPARLGVHATVSGRQFTCVPIRDVLKFDVPYSKCAYVKSAKKI